MFDWPATGTGIRAIPNVPYTTRVLVRRPLPSERFSGRVVVEMLNPSNLFDLNIGWAIHHDEIVSPRRRSGRITALRQWSQRSRRLIPCDTPLSAGEPARRR